MEDYPVTPAVLPTPRRLQANERFLGRGVTIGIVDAAFHPHPDLVRPQNRIRAWVDASIEAVEERWFDRDDVPVWPEMPPRYRAAEWHGLMTSTTAAGNGWLSGGRFRALASESHLALVRVSTGDVISNDAITRALRWLRKHALALELGVVSLSVGGDATASDGISEIDDEVEALVADGVVVVAAAGNDGIRRLLPPATSFDAITVGGIDDHNTISRDAWEIWHSNYGPGGHGVNKPEAVAPSFGIVAPVLPGTDLATESRLLFGRTGSSARPVDRRIADLGLVSPHYHLVEGTSVAAPIVASLAASMLEANPELSPEAVKTLLMATAQPIVGASDRQGAGAVHAGRAVAAALRSRSKKSA
jgi:serine protease AprX